MPAVLDNMTTKNALKQNVALSCLSMMSFELGIYSLSFHRLTVNNNGTLGVNSR